jgi:hypothetical protein
MIEDVNYKCKISHHLQKQLKESFQPQPSFSGGISREDALLSSHNKSGPISFSQIQPAHIPVPITPLPSPNFNNIYNNAMDPSSYSNLSPSSIIPSPPNTSPFPTYQQSNQYQMHPSSISSTSGYIVAPPKNEPGLFAENQSLPPTPFHYPRKSASNVNTAVADISSNHLNGSRGYPTQSPRFIGTSTNNLTALALHQHRMSIMATVAASNTDMDHLASLSQSMLHHSNSVGSVTSEHGATTHAATTSYSRSSDFSHSFSERSLSSNTNFTGQQRTQSSLDNNPNYPSLKVPSQILPTPTFMQHKHSNHNNPPSASLTNSPSLNRYNVYQSSSSAIIESNDDNNRVVLNTGNNNYSINPPFHLDSSTMAAEKITESLTTKSINQQTNFLQENL